MTKSIAIISGKGGTGKTSITASFAVLAHNAVIVDCDVDAADLHLILSPKIIEENIFRSGYVALIDPEKCTRCGECARACAFNAIPDVPTVDHIACEGCGVCKLVCPEDAVSMKPAECGRWYISKTRAGPMVHARLDPGRENSGRLVSLVRTKAGEIAKRDGRNLIIIDGPPGVGCPVIASVGGSDLVVIVTEPTLSGIHDLKRALKLAEHFRIKAAVVINKWNLCERLANETVAFCEGSGIPVLGKIPYSTDFTHAQLAQKSLVEYNDTEAAKEIRRTWQNMIEKGELE